MASLPITQLADSPNKTHELCIPAYGYSRFISPALLSCSSPFYSAYLANHGSALTSSICAHCGHEHTATKFCLPYNYAPLEIEFLLDFLERTPHGVIPPPLFLSVIRLCDYLMIDQDIIYAMIQLYLPGHFRRPLAYTRALVDTLNNTSYSNLGRHFAATYLDENS